MVLAGSVASVTASVTQLSVANAENVTPSARMVVVPDVRHVATPEATVATAGALLTHDTDGVIGAPFDETIPNCRV